MRSAPILFRSHLALLCALADAARRSAMDPPVATVTDDELAVELGIKPDTVYRLLRRLEEVGAIQLGRARRNGPRRVVCVSSSWAWAAAGVQWIGVQTPGAVA